MLVVSLRDGLAIDRHKQVVWQATRWAPVEGGTTSKRRVDSRVNQIKQSRLNGTRLIDTEGASWSHQLGYQRDLAESKCCLNFL